MMALRVLSKKYYRHNVKRMTKNANSFSQMAAASKSKEEEIIWPRRIFSGVQPTGSLHLGNYVGAVKKWVELQNKGEDVMISIVDLHSITLPQEPNELKKNILEMTATLLACGIDPKKSTLFLQSSVSMHAELGWILGCFATMARLAHLPQFKEKSESIKEIPLGLYVYPVLQAADILLYKATHVPVGEDQLQHLQMAQQLVKTFNHRFGKTFPSPLPLVGDVSCSRLKSLRDPTKKMSKSEPNPKSRILLIDTPEIITMKIKKSVTDFTPEVTYDPTTRPGVSNLIDIHCIMSDKIPEEVCEEMEGVNTGRYKSVVSEAVCQYMEPIRTKLESYLSKPQYLIDVLNEGSAKATSRAQVTHKEVMDKVGLGIPVLSN